jgi:hypothetical protein
MGPVLAKSGCSSVSRSVVDLSSSLVSCSKLSLLVSDSPSIEACLSCLASSSAGVTGAVGCSRCSGSHLVGGFRSSVTSIGLRGTAVNI